MPSALEAFQNLLNGNPEIAAIVGAVTQGGVNADFTPPPPPPAVEPDWAVISPQLLRQVVLARKGRYRGDQEPGLRRDIPCLSCGNPYRPHKVTAINLLLCNDCQLEVTPANVQPDTAPVAAVSATTYDPLTGSL